MQQPSPTQTPIVTLSNKHHLQPFQYQPIHYGSTSTLDPGSTDSPEMSTSGSTTTFPIIDPHHPTFSTSPPSDPLPLLFQGHHGHHRPASASGSLSPALSLGSINSLETASSASAYSDRSKSPRNSLKNKLIKTFSRSTSGSKQKLVNLEGTTTVAADGSRSNPMFDYENLDDIHDNEVSSTPVPTPEPDLGDEKMFEINLNGGGGCTGGGRKDQEVQGHDGHEHHDHHDHHDHEHHGHTHNHHHHRKTLKSSESSELTHCHDSTIDSTMDQQARRAMIKLVIGLVLCAIFMIIELVGGYFSKSLAIFTDAAHLTSDLVSFLISLTAIFLGQRRPTQAKSFGYYRFEVLGVLVSVVTIWLMTGILLYLALQRIVHQDFELDSTAMLIVSSIGLGMNLLMMFVLADGIGSCFGTLCGVCLPVGGSKKKSKTKKAKKVKKGHVVLEQQELGTPEKVDGGKFGFGTELERGHDHEDDHGHGHGHSHGGASHGHSHGFAGHGHSHMNMNVRAAILHIVGDIIQSIGVLLAALIVHFWPHLKLVDPICTLIFGIIVFFTTYRILSDTLHILMEGFPREFQYDAVKRLLVDHLPDTVVTVHSLHIWALTHGRNALMVHITVDREKIKDGNGDNCFEEVRIAAEKIIRAELGISQTTVQVEYHQAEIEESCSNCVGPKA